MSAPLAVYVHFPWCVRKCPYCDFNSHPVRGSVDEPAYLDALLNDLHRQRQDPSRSGPITTTFFGGGTPSLFSPEAFARINEQLSDASEVTMEANPGTTEHADFGAYHQAGINRLSIGAQTFSAHALQTLGRIHAADDTVHAFEQARRGGFDNINVDLMYALPEQTVDEAVHDLARAVELGPEHISWYQLTIEPRTEFFSRPPPLPADSTVEEIERAGRALLEANGFRRYEVSAWARPGRECAHNLNYWQFGDYLGVGAGAHGKIGRLRTEKARQPRLYQAEPTDEQRRELYDDDLVFECLLGALRLADGISWGEFEAATGLKRDVIAARWDEAADQGLVRPNRVATTPLGYQHLDTVLTKFLPADKLQVEDLVT